MNGLKKLPREEFDTILGKKTNEIENELKRFLPEGITQQKIISDAMEYSLMGGGKRLRPLFMKEAYALFSDSVEEGLSYFMAAIEMIHTYSLVHDDLPAMDDDDYRRGRETTHKVFGEDMGILCGDALLNYAYETALEGARHIKNQTAAIEAVSLLARKAGIYGMVGGQVVDVEMTGKPLTKEQLDFIYHLKTGALIEASFMIGAVLAGASEESVDALEQIGECVGMAFQIQDDILDLTSTTEELGKPVHSDEKNEKTTFISLFGLDAAKEVVEEYSNRALGLLENLSAAKGNAFLNTLIQRLIDRKK